MPSSSVLAAICLTLLAATAAVAGSAVAQTRDKAREPDRERVVRDEGRSGHGSASHRELSDAVRRVERRTGGQVLSAERVPYDGRDVSRVKIVDSSGRVRVYVDDPARGGNGSSIRALPRSVPTQPPPSTRRADN